LDVIRLRIFLRSLVLGALFSTGCGSSTETPEHVRNAAIDAGVLGKAPAEVKQKLEALTFGDGRHLVVGSFVTDRSVIEAQLRDSKGQPRTDWNVNVTVRFDASWKADSVAAFSSAVSPM
jgi:hypothetical protein